MNKRQSWEWMYLPSAKHQLWNHLSVMARGVALELWRITGGEPMALCGDDYRERLLAYIYVVGNERRTVRRALDELVRYGIIKLEGDSFRIELISGDYSPNPALSEREPIVAKVRAAVIARDGLVCGICRSEVDPDDVHIDHVVPVSKGGKSNTENLRVAHSRCNYSRGNRDLESN